ncbi:hypothetical protein [Evansella tamaricis]|uniref:Uncharacterized protein n=1 Tax=Evansella tamaricis TaxID=2069301 RepID=A0ABS6JM63_9BACI|nr:hypothetical protein [Evansella tamaricis]MBU9714450.1 hypothetical protein [Evansella tamaricis]
MIDIKTLKKGQYFKNYKELCLELDIEIKKNTNSKNAQLKELSRYCRYHTEGHKFIIDEVYNNPKPKEDNRGKQGVFTHLMQTLIMDYLVEQNKQTVYVTRNHLLHHIRMMNKNYTYCSENVPQLSKMKKIEEKIIYDFFNTTNSNFKSAFMSVLANLRNRSLIMYEKVTSICQKDNIHRPATEDEKESIQRCEKEVLNELGYKEMSHVRISSKWNEFKKRMSQLLLFNYDIRFYYISYKITVNRDYISDEYEDTLNLTLSELKREGLKNELNRIVMERLIANSKLRKKRASNPTQSTKMDKYRLQFSYEDDNEKLVNLLIDYTADDITDEINRIAAEDMKFKIEEEEFESLFS